MDWKYFVNYFERVKSRSIVSFNSENSEFQIYYRNASDALYFSLPFSYYLTKSSII